MARYEHGDVYLFRGDCGHEWVGAVTGYWGCPVCGRYDGDHHIAHMAPIAVQVEDDLGGAGEALAAAADGVHADKDIK